MAPEPAPEPEPPAGSSGRSGGSWGLSSVRAVGAGVWSMRGWGQWGRRRALRALGAVPVPRTESIALPAPSRPFLEPSLMASVTPVHLLTARHALRVGHRRLAAMLLLETAASFNLWRKPDRGMRRNFDMACTIFTSLWFVGLGTVSGGVIFLLAPLACSVLSYSCEHQVRPSF